ncbi:MAG TPA: MdtA/MuxA family multidrug efflux RND transporter periplasmic adaptor subunit [Candidatus Angelobacter sp.]|nr:MdtA/MuxA family multidrug efflux RND transporter periplasmic adaptor subunit [Candidatus Angelobacter sp.]
MFNRRVLLPVCWMGLSAGLTLSLLACGKTTAAAPTKGQLKGQAVPVAVAKAETRDVPVYLNGLGAVEAFNTVTLKTRLDGQLVQIAFREGQNVKKGALIAVIDPRPYEAALNQAQANLFKDQASLKDAQVNLVRDQELYKATVIAKQQLDTQASLVGQLEGTVGADEAMIQTAKLNLTYTRIYAPVNGRVGLRQVDIGNIVHASDPNGLLVLTQLQPIAATFTLPEDNLTTVSQHMHAATLPVDAYSRDDQTKIASGTLLTIDNQIDAATGTGKLKAVFPNLDESLWPNQFVNIHLLLEVHKDATVIPSVAIQRGPQGSYVFVVKPDKTVDMRIVTPGLSVGTSTAIDSGLAPGESVVTDGQDKLQAGGKVEIRSGPGATPSGGNPAGGKNGGADSGQRPQGAGHKKP